MYVPQIWFSMEAQSAQEMWSTSSSVMKFFLILWTHDFDLASNTIGQFSEAGLHEWMPFVIFYARSCERLQRHFRADFWVGIASRCV